MDSTPIKFCSERKFGIELEINSSDHRDFKRDRLRDEEMPEGIAEIGLTIRSATKSNVLIKRWHSTHGNNSWVLKPDSSCGIEACSPVSKGWYGLEPILKAIQAVKMVPWACADDRCGLHLHGDVSDMSAEQLGSLLAYWIKCEAVFLDSVPASRKRNRYCRQLGLSDCIDVNTPIDVSRLITLMGGHKYHTMNTFHMAKGNRSTVEWRIAEGAACLDGFYVKNWTRLLLHFVDRVIQRPIPPSYRGSDSFSGLLWLDPEQVFEVLGFFDPLSPGLIEVRNWFLARLYSNVDSGLPGCWSGVGRSIAKNQIISMYSRFGLGPVEDILRPKDMEKTLFSLETRW